MDENTDVYYAKTFRDIKMFNAFKTRSVFGNQTYTMFIYFPGTAFVFVSAPCVGVFNSFAHKVFGRKYFCRKSSNMVHNFFSPCVNTFTHGLEYISHMAKPSSVYRERTTTPNSNKEKSMDPGSILKHRARGPT